MQSTRRLLFCAARGVGHGLAGLGLSPDPVNSRDDVGGGVELAGLNLPQPVASTRSEATAA
jgi:hypothetical protein